MTDDHSPNSSANSRQRHTEPRGQLRPKPPEAPGVFGPPSAAAGKTRNWIALSGVAVPTAVVALFLTLWLIRRNPIPRDIPVATARDGSSYYVFGTRHCEILNGQFLLPRGHVVETSGSGENVQMLQGQTAQLAMYQGGTVALDDAVIVAPLYREVVHVLIKKRVFEDSKYAGRESTVRLVNVRRLDPPFRGV